MIAFGLVAACLGIGDREIHVFERAAAREIADHLMGDHKTVKVRVEPDGIGIIWGALDKATIEASHFEVDNLPLYVEPERSQAGRCGNLTLNLSDFRVRGLRIDKLSASIPACRYDRALALKSKSFRLSRSGLGSGFVRVQQDDLAAFILKKYHEIKSVEVKVKQGVVWVEGEGEFLLAKSKFTVVASMTVESGTRLNLTDAKVWFDWKRADPFAAETLLKTLNPVVDFDRDLGLLDAMKIEKLTLEKGVIEAFGKTKIPLMPGSLAAPMPKLPKRPKGDRRVSPPDFLPGLL